MTILTPFDWLSQIVGTICQGPPPSYLLSPLPHLTLFPLFLLSLTLQQHAEGVVFGHYGGRGPRPRPHARGGVVGRPQRALGEGSPPAGTSLSVATCVGAGRGGGGHRRRGRRCGHTESHRSREDGWECVEQSAAALVWGYETGWRNGYCDQWRWKHSTVHRERELKLSRRRYESVG